MRKTFLLIALLLTLAGSASAADLTTAASPAPAPAPAQDLFLPAPNQTAACTVSCFTDPNITCSSQSGNCSRGGFWGVYWITCDGVRTMCPEF
jgi:hypothetical protein